MKWASICFAVLLVAVLVGGLMSSCAPTEPEVEPTPETEAEPTPETEAEPTPEPEVEPTPEPEVEADPDTLVVAVSGDIESLDLHQLAGTRGWPVVYATYGRALEWGREVDPDTGLEYLTYDWRPGLVESWEQREDEGKLIYTMRLRQGCYFESGNELTADDIKYKVGRMNELRPWNNTVYGCNEGADCINILDDYTFELIFDAPNAISHVGASVIPGSIVDSQELQENYVTDEDPWGHDFLRTNTLGIGAYRLEETVPGSEVVLVKNQDYCAPDYMHGYFDRIILKIIPDPSTQMLLLREGEVDLAPELGPKEALDLVGQPGVEVQTFASQNLLMLGLNLEIEPYDDVRVRQALAYASPSELIVGSVYEGAAQTASGLVPAGTLGGTDEYWVYHRDLEKARELLEDAGYPDGFEMTVHFDLARPMREDVGVLLQTAFAEIGVDVTLVADSPAAFHETLRDFRLPAFINSSLGWINDAGYYMDMVYASWGFGNYGNYESPELDQILTDAWPIIDDEERFQLYYSAQEILDAEVPVIALAQPDYLISLRDDIEGFAKGFDELPRYHNLRRAR